MFKSFYLEKLALLTVGIGIGWGLAVFLPFRGSPNFEAPAPSEVALPSGTSLNTATALVPHATPAAAPRDLKSLKDDFEAAINAGDLRRAREQLEALAKDGENSREHLESKTRLLVFSRSYEEAKEVLGQCLRLFPDSKSCLVDNASVAASAGTKEEHEKAVSACLALFPKEMECRNLLAILRMNQGRYPLAISLYQEMIRENGDRGIRYPEWLLDSQLAYALEGAGRFKDAAAAFERSCRTGQNPGACQKFEQVRVHL